jgi:hypothetical protein
MNVGRYLQTFATSLPLYAHCFFPPVKSILILRSWQVNLIQFCSSEIQSETSPQTGYMNLHLSTWGKLVQNSIGLVLQ